MSRYQRIYDALSIELKPEALSIVNESHRHNVPEGSETHFKVVAVSARFESLGRLARHRLINTLLKNEFSADMHALTLHLFTPKEWLEHNATVPKSPACRNRTHKDEL